MNSMHKAILTLVFVFTVGSLFAQDSSKIDVVELYVPPIKNVLSEYRLDVDKSEIGWNVTTSKGPQDGTIRLKSGRIFFRNSDLVSGIFNMDLNTVTISSLPPGILNMHALTLLKSKDFLDIYAYSSAILEIATARKIAPGKYRVSGFLTIKGIKRPIDFNVTGIIKDNAFEGKAEAIQVDRDEFNIATSQATLGNGSDEQINSAIEKTFYINVNISATKFK